MDRKSHIFFFCISQITANFRQGAARDGKLQQLRTLLAEGWNLATRDQHGSNALLWAAGTKFMGHDS